MVECSGIVIAGAAGSGKRDVAFALTLLSRRYARFPALTTASESSLDSVQASAAQVSDLRQWAQVFHEVVRDGAVLVYDHVRLNQIRDAGQLPVVTVDTVASMAAFEREAPGWLPVYLWRPEIDGRKRRELERAHDRFVVNVRTDLLTSVGIAQVIHVVAQSLPSEER